MSDQEQAIFGKQNKFQKFFEKIIEIKDPEQTKVSWKDWKNIKKQICPKHNFTTELINKAEINLDFSDKTNYQTGQKVFVFDQDCKHFHKGEILDMKNDVKILYEGNFKCSNIGTVTKDNILVLNNNDYDNYRKLQNNWNLEFVQNMNLKALTFILKLLEFKYFLVQKLENILENSQVLNKQDVLYYQKNIQIIDKYLKNAFLVLRIKTNQEFNIDELLQNYVFLVTQIKNEIKKQISDDQDEKQEWIKQELLYIEKSLNKKQERKIIHDTKIKIQEFLDQNKINLDENSDVMNSIVDSLGLIRSLQVEGDIDYDQNGFYQRLLPRIQQIFENDNPDQKMHNFSSLLYKIVENFKTTLK